MPVLRGVNVHIGSWSQASYDDMAALGARVVRLIVLGDQFEPAQAWIDPTMIGHLDTDVARAQAAGMYIELDLHLKRRPRAVVGVCRARGGREVQRLRQTLTQYLATRYGSSASPKYTKAVLSFGLNEPPLEDDAIRNGNTAIPYLETSSAR